ncbi:Hypothetical predicted protein, partial [Marmota monax]
TLNTGPSYWLLPSASSSLRETTGLPDHLMPKVSLVQALQGEEEADCVSRLPDLEAEWPPHCGGTVGKSLSVQCQCEETVKSFTKSWCRPPCLPPWNQAVKARASAAECPPRTTLGISPSL